MNNKDYMYKKPVMTVVREADYPILCTSPDAGAIENIEYDDWVVSGVSTEI